MLRSVDALALTRELRAAARVPVILIGDYGTAAERIVGLEMGALDCMDRPLLVRELVARIRTVLRRTSALALRRCGAATASASTAGCCDAANATCARPPAHPVALSNGEFQLLWTFLDAPRRAVSRDELAGTTPGERLEATSRSVDLLVSRLRRKLAAPPDRPALIRSVRGVGYLFDARSIEALA